MKIKQLLENIDLFNVTPNLNISGKSKVSVNEGIILSIVVYLLSILILFKNLKSVYTNNNPIYSNSYKIRDLNTTENISISNMNFSFSYYSIQNIKEEKRVSSKISKLSVISDDVLSNKFITQAQILIPKYLNQTSAFRSLNIGNYTQHCELSNYSDFSSNSICLNFYKNLANDKKNKYFMNNSEFKNIDDFIKNEDGILKFPGSFIQTSLQIENKNIFSISPCAIITDNSNITNFNKKALNDIKNTKEQSNDQKTDNLNQINKSCLENFSKNNFGNFIFLFYYQSDLPDAYTDLGYKTETFAENTNFDPYKEYLKITIKFTKNIIISDDSMFYDFGPVNERTYYSKEISITKELLDKNATDLILNYDFILNDKVNIMNRSYNKIDAVFASIFSMIEILLIVGKTLSHFFNKNCLEYEIINNLYYYSNQQTLTKEFEPKKENADFQKIKSDISNKNTIVKLNSTKSISLNDNLNKNYKKEYEKVKDSSLKSNSVKIIEVERDDYVPQSIKHSEIIKASKLKNVDCYIKVDSKSKESPQKNYDSNSNKINKKIEENEKIIFENKKHELDFKSEQQTTENFFFKSGIKDYFYNMSYCCLSKHKRENLNLKLKAVELVNKEFDLQLIISNMIKLDSLSSKSETDFYVKGLRNLSNIDSYLTIFDKKIKK